MNISKEDLQEFKKIYYQEFGVELNDNEAYESASNLTGFMKILIEAHAKY
jgi:hypothetical protein